MKNSFAIVLILFLSGCDGIQHKYLPIVSVYSIVHSESSIYSKIQIVVPRKTVEVNIVYYFKPFVVINHSDTIPLKSMKILGSKLNNADSTCSYKYGGTFYSTDTIPIWGLDVRSIEFFHQSELYINKRSHLRLNLRETPFFYSKLNENE